MCVCVGGGGWSDPESSIPHYITKNEFMYDIQWRVQEFVRGGGENRKINFFCLSLFQGGGAAQKIAEIMIFPTKKVAKYR